MSDMIENKTRQLEHDSKNLDFGNEEEEETEKAEKAPATTTPAQSAKNTPVQKSTKRQAHTEEKAEKQPSKFAILLFNSSSNYSLLFISRCSSPSNPILFTQKSKPESSEFF